MKHIIVAGPTLTGKTTLIKKILREIPKYNLIEEEVIASIATDFSQTVTQKNDFMCTIEVDVNKINKITSKALSKAFEYSTSFYHDLSFILETYSYSLEDLKKEQDKGNIVIVLGCSNLTPEKLLNDIRETETNHDRTSAMGNWRLLFEIKASIQESKYYKKKCKELNIPYFETSINRQKVLNDAFEFVKNKLKKPTNC